MSGADECLSNDGITLFDHEDLASEIEWILKGDAQSPEILARLFTRFRQAIDGGLQGILQTRAALVTAVELVYLQTGAHVAALKLYRLSLEGQLKIEDEPGNLISAAIKRGTSSRLKGQVSGRARQKSGSGNSHR